MYQDVLEAIKALEIFATKAKGRIVADLLPKSAAQTLGDGREPPIPEGLAEKGVRALIAASTAVSEQTFTVGTDSGYAGEDLVALVPAVEAIGYLRILPKESVPFLVALLETNTFGKYQSKPDSSTYSRDSDLEDAQDEIAEVAIAALSRFRADAAEGMDALKAAFEHRRREVRSVAKDVYAAIEYHTS